MFQIAPAAPDARAARPASAPLRRQDGPPHRRDPRGDPTHASLCAATAQTVGSVCRAPTVANRRHQGPGRRSALPRTPEGFATLGGTYRPGHDVVAARAAHLCGRAVIIRAWLPVAAVPVRAHRPHAMAVRLAPEAQEPPPPHPRKTPNPHFPKSTLWTPSRPRHPRKTPGSAFSRINPMNPEPTPPPAQNPGSAFSRINPLNPEPAAAPAQNPGSAFSRIDPLNPEPAAAPAQHREPASSQINPLNSEPSPAARNRASPRPRSDPLHPSGGGPGAGRRHLDQTRDPRRPRPAPGGRKLPHLRSDPLHPSDGDPAAPARARAHPARQNSRHLSGPAAIPRTGQAIAWRKQGQWLRPWTPPRGAAPWNPAKGSGP